MSRRERESIVIDCLNLIRMNYLNRIERITQQYLQAKTQLEELYAHAHLTVLRGAKIVGMTTTGAAKFQKLIAALKPAIVVCEEAAEVLESHVLATLSQHTKQLILIGDHMQLRPKAQVYDLEVDSGKGYDLDKSLFERLADGPLKKNLVTLTTQRRMRPMIANLVRNTLYPKLSDHISVSGYPPVGGMCENLYWLDHKVLEKSGGMEEETLGRSKVNAHEVKLVVALTNYLISQVHIRPSNQDVVPFADPLH